MSNLEPFESAQNQSRRAWVNVAVVAVVAVAVAAGAWLLLRPAEPPAAETEPATPSREVASPAPPPVQAAPEAVASAPSPPAPRRAKPKPAPAPAAPVEPPAPTTATLTIETDVPGAMVFVDREFKGNSPVTIEGVAPGTHRLNVSAEGYEGFSDTIELAAGPRTVSVKFKEVRLNESLAVVHKHTVGSCQGRLIATPQGIRYETSNKNDAFMVKFADLEVFEIDYLNKNLRIKVKGGRTFNFTGESADALFVFHRNVQAARERLAKGDPPAPTSPK